MRRKYLRADLARDLELSPSSITKLAKRGMPCHSKGAAEEWRRQHLDPALTKHAPAESPPERPPAASSDPDAPATEAELRRRLLAAQVATAERSARAEDGERIAVAAVQRALRRWVGALIGGVRGQGATLEQSIRMRSGPGAATAGLRRLVVSYENGAIHGALHTLGVAMAAEHAGLGAMIAALAADRDHSGEPASATSSAADNLQ